MERQAQVYEAIKSGVVIPATPLALRADRTFNEEGQRLLTRYYLASGSGGIATAVHTTQFEIRRPEYNLFQTVLKTVFDEVSAYEQNTGRLIVKVAGVCGELEQAVSEAKTAKECGADVVLLSPGGLNNLSEDALAARTRAVAEVLPVIGFYLQSAVGGRQFSYRYWEQICEIPNVVAIKCASFNRYQTLDVVRAAAFSSRSEEIALYTGNDDNIVVDLLTEYQFQKDGRTVAKGFVGGLLGHWSVWTSKAVELLNQVKQVRQSPDADHLKELLTLAAQVTDANGAFFDVINQFQGCIAGLHEVLRRQGLLEGIWCLDPKETLSLGQDEEIDRVYAAYPHLNDDAFVRANLSNWKAGYIL